MNYKRGDIFYADLSPVVGSEQGGVRPVLIVQNDVGNRYSPTVIAAAITSQKEKAKLPTHIELKATESGLPKDSIVLLEQIRTIDKQRLKERMGNLRGDSMGKINQALSISFGLGGPNSSATYSSAVYRCGLCRKIPSPVLRKNRPLGAVFYCSFFPLSFQ